MLRQKRIKNGTTGAGGMSSVVVVWLILGWSRPAFSDEQRHLQLAPIQFSTTTGGYVDYLIMRDSYSGNAVTQQTLSAEANVLFRASSFFWQPWLARVSGSLGLGVGDGISSSSNSSSNTSGNKSIMGDANLNVLAYSRFPFNARAYRTNSQTTGYLSDTNSNFQSSGYSLDQTYRTRDGRLDSIASFTRGISGRVNYGTEDINNQFNFTLSTQPLYSHYTLRVIGLVNDVDHPLTGEKGMVESLVVNHLFQPNDFVQVGTLVNILKNSNTLASGPTKQDDSSSRQLLSIASWRAAVTPINIVSSARISEADVETDGVTSSKTSDTNFNIGANYAWSPLIRMYGSVNVNDSSGIQTTSTNAGLTAQKGFNEREVATLGGWRYSQTVGASLSNSTNTITNGASNTTSQTTNSSVQSMGGNFGHNLSKSTSLGKGSLTTTLNQSISEGLSSAVSPSARLNSSGIVTWNSMEGRTHSILQGRVMDSRYFTGTQNFSQLINLQASRDQQMAHNQSLIGSLTIQGSRTGANNIPTTPFILSPSGNLNYRHQRLFAVKHLDFDSSLNIIGADIVALQGSAPQQDVSIQEHANTDWENNLTYVIGRLNMRLSARIAEVNQATQYSIFFHMNRSF
jgi:hypothetical protein